MGGDRVGEVAGRGAGDRVEAELLGARERDGDDAVLERVRRVGGLVLDAQLAEAEALGEAVGLHERRPARRQRGAGGTLEREEVGVAPERVRPGLDPALELLGLAVGRAVGHLERTEAALADVARVERVGGRALLALQGICRHMKNPPPVLCGGGFAWAMPSPHLPGQSLEPDGIATVSRVRADGWRGFIGPVPPPLWMRTAMWRRIVANRFRRLPGDRGRVESLRDAADDRRAAQSGPCRACPGPPSVVARARSRAAERTPERPTSRASRSSRPPACAGSTSSARARSTRRGWRSASSSTRSTTRTSSRATSARRSTSTTTTCSSSCTSRATTRRSRGSTPPSWTSSSARTT